MVSKVEIYTWSNCVYSQKAKTLLERRQVKYVEYCLDNDEQAREQMRIRANGSNTLPQIFINNTHVGGYSELYFLIELATFEEMLDFCKIESSREDDVFFSDS